MSKKVFFGRNDFRFLYLRFKDSRYYVISVIVLTITTCIFLLFNIIFPQINKYFSIRSEAVAQREKIRIIRDNINVISLMDKTALDAQLQSASVALPPEKDFAGILNAISYSAVLSGVTIGDYNFKIGEINSVNTDTNAEVIQSEIPTEIVINIDGNINNVKTFLKEMNERLPLSNISEVDYSRGTTTITAKFFHKPFSKVSFIEDKPLKTVSLEKKELLGKMREWQEVSLVQDISLPSGSASAPLFE